MMRYLIIAIACVFARAPERRQENADEQRDNGNDN